VTSSPFDITRFHALLTTRSSNRIGDQNLQRVLESSVVRVATSAWMTELQLMAPQIMAAINAGRGAARIKTIRWLLSQ